MARADLTFSTGATPRIVPHSGVAIREDIAFANAKGNEKRAIRKAADNTLRKLAEPLRKVLQRDEAVFCVCHARTPMNLLEQYTFRSAAYFVAGCVLVVTNKRLLQLRIDPKGEWTKSMREVPWTDVRQARTSGWLGGFLTLEYRSGKKERYWGINGNDKGRLKVLAPRLIEEGRTEAPGAGEMHAACPECLGALQAHVYDCPQCGLIFKNEGEIYWRALIPSLSYMYTGHPVLAVLDGLGEAYGVFLMLAGAVGVAQGTQGAAVPLVAGAIIFGVDYLICLQHNLRFVGEFLPTDEHRANVGAGVRAAA